MLTVGLFEAKRRLSELVDRAREGERIGITRRGKLEALIVPVRAEANLQEVFKEIERIRERARTRKGVIIKSLIEEGRV